MKKTKLVSFVFLFIGLLTYSQSLMFEIPIKEQIDKSSQIIEGKVIAKKSFWDTNHQNIYTVQTIEVYKIFKGEKLKTIEVITPGGVIDFKSQIVNPSLKLRIGDIGIFMLTSNPKSLALKPNSNTVAFKPFSSKQGFYRYNLVSNIAANPFKVRNGIKTNFYTELESHLNQKFHSIREFNVENEVLLSKKSSSKRMMSVSSISPVSISAGTASALTITGTGFGATQGTGTVSFPNPDDGGATFVAALNSQTISWSDTEIQVEVPSDSGTGQVQITPDGGSPMLSQILTITFSVLNLNYDFDADPIDENIVASPTRHVDRNGTGGYTWQMQTDFDANTAAKESFIRAFDSWKCETGINWTLGSVTTVDVISNDDINIIRFDNGSLPAGVLGRCTSRYAAQCLIPNNIVYWYVEEIDIVFNDDTNWNYGPAAPAFVQYDFESVALHELGHGHQLNHVINSVDVMHYSISNSISKRTLNTNNINGAANVHARSIQDFSCSPTGYTQMIAYSCPTTSINDYLLAQGTSVFPNPTTGALFINNSSSFELQKAIIFDSVGRFLFSTDIHDFKRTKIINVNTLSPGVYFINLISENAAITKKFLVE